VRAALPSAEAQVAALAAALASRWRRLRCRWDDRAVWLEVPVGKRAVGVAVRLDLVVLAPTDALAAELDSHLVALRARPRGWRAKPRHPGGTGCPT
jgi:hypothetical protein